MTQHINQGIYYARGRYYESRALRLLKKLGFDAKAANGNDPYSHDLQIGSCRIEVKGSRLHDLKQRKRGYQFSLYRAGKAKHSESDFMLLLCFDQNHLRGVFVIPSQLTEDVHCITIPNINPKNYSGRWSIWFKDRKSTRLNSSHQL